METKNISEKEINVISLMIKLWEKKKFIFKVTGIGLIVGLIIAFSIPNEYTTSVLVTPDSQSSSTGTMSSLAALAGVSLNKNTEDALSSPSLYPYIFSSTTFLKGFYDISVENEGQEMSLYTYMREHQKKPWWKYITSAPYRLIALFSSSSSNNNNTLPSDTILESGISCNVIEASDSYISKADLSVIGELRSRFFVEYDKKTGVTTVEVIMQDPIISSYLADTLTAYLQSYIIEYRTQKSRRDLEYAEKLYAESKNDYYNAQSNLARFMDGNINVVSASYRTTQEKLQNEANLSYAIYNQTAQQLQMAKIKVQNNTPVFTIIQPGVQPFLPAKPNVKMIVVAIMLLTFIGACIWVLRKLLLDFLINKDFKN